MPSLYTLPKMTLLTLAGSIASVISVVALCQALPKPFETNIGKPLPQLSDGSSRLRDDLEKLIFVPSRDRLLGIAKGLSTDLAYGEARLRGPADSTAFASLSPSVVLVLTASGTGTGSLVIAPDLVLTNWHVVGTHSEVDVIYRPSDVSKEVYAEKVHRASVVKVDQVADLALLKISNPRQDVEPLVLSDEEPDIGEDVSAIGHPYGLTWSYTRGIVTGKRDQFDWRYDLGFQHSARVIQTQTPINPGNSGGPLFDASGQISGINSFKNEGEGINFAVSAATVREFLDREGSRYTPRVPGSPAMQEFLADCHEPTQVGDSELSEDGLTESYWLDLNCDGLIDALSSESLEEGPSRLAIDTAQDGILDTTLIDFESDGRYDLSFYDLDADGEADLVGYHADEASSSPSEFVSYGKFLASI